MVGKEITQRLRDSQLTARIFDTWEEARTNYRNNEGYTATRDGVTVTVKGLVEAPDIKVADHIKTINQK